MNRFRRRVAVAVASSVVALMGLTMIAEAAEFAVPTEVTIGKARTNKAVIFFGEVFSIDDGEGSPDAGECSVGRKITLFRVTNHGDVNHGSLHSDGFGSYAGKLRNAHEGRYYVRAARMVFADEYGDLVVCRAAESRTVRVR